MRDIRTAGGAGAKLPGDLSCASTYRVVVPGHSLSLSISPHQTALPWNALLLRQSADPGPGDATIAGAEFYISVFKLYSIDCIPQPRQ